MMQTTKARHRDNARRKHRLFCRRSTAWSLLRQPEMCPVVVVVADVLTHEAFQMCFIEYNHMVQKITATGANETLGHAVLPRTFESSSHRLQPDGLDGFPDLGIEDRVPVVDQVFLRRIVGKCFTKLLRNPRASWMPRDVEAQHTPMVVSFLSSKKSR
jgi:hypothetical protein